MAMNSKPRESEDGDIFDAVANAAAGAADATLKFVDDAVTTVKVEGEKIVEATSEAVSSAGQAISNAAVAAGDAVSNATTAVQDAADSAVEAVKTAGQEVADTATSVMSAVGGALCEAPPRKEGWVFKQGEVNKAFQQRWFVLQDGCVTYYKQKESKNAQGSFSVYGAEVKLAQPKGKIREGFQVTVTTGRTYTLRVESEEECAEWVELLERAALMEPPNTDTTGENQNDNASDKNKQRA